ncbi:MAG: type II toxin-antitoxin system HicB family antitoxin [Methanosarcinales archaeon]|nr:type II toxin-antitoxin system HicB family antitoxin [Methanosarcinales archaeon]
MKTFIFNVVIEDDPFEDGRMAYHTYCPALDEYGAATWGFTRDEALKNIQEVVRMIVEELIEDGKPIPESPKKDVQIFTEQKVMVTV